MNSSRNIGASDGQERQFDLLVDGELDEKDRRELLSRLDHEPDGWRRCALAFLQAQAWQQALGPMVSPAEARAAGPLGRPRSGAARLGAGIWSTCWLWRPASWWPWQLGMQLRDRGWSSPRVGKEPAVESVAKTTTPTTLPTAPATPAPSLASKAQPSLAAAPANPWQMVTLTAGGGTDGAKQSFELPARKSDRLDECLAEQAPRGNSARGYRGPEAKRSRGPAAAGVAPGGNAGRKSVGRAGGRGGHPQCPPATIIVPLLLTPSKAVS